MKAGDVMVSTVISVGPNARVEEVAQILLANRISAVPVIDEQGKLLGVVSEGDLIRRVEAGTDRGRRSWWLEYLTGKQVLAAEYVKSHSHKVADVMTRSVFTATEDTPLADIANLLERNRIKRVPIVRDGKVVGIVSRANLLQALASTRTKHAPASAGDLDIRAKVISRLNAELWRPSMLNVTVNDGAVDLWGFVTSDDERKAARIAAEEVPGVKAINDNLMIPPPGFAAL